MKKHNQCVKVKLPFYAYKAHHHSFWSFHSDHNNKANVLKLLLPLDLTLNDIVENIFHKYEYQKTGW
jgi:hypothetical protein